MRRLLFPVVLVVLAVGLWLSNDLVEIAAGIALFMFGMSCLENGFNAFTGGTLEGILRKSTNTKFKSICFGAASTTLMQSSSLVSLITISFVSAELISLVAGIGIIMGANIGTTTGAWLIAGLGLKVDIAAYAMPMLIFGVILVMQKPKLRKASGYLLLGTGFLFLGIHYMKDGFAAFQNSFDLSQYSIEGLLGILIFTLIGMLITVVMQSSHATLLIIISALAAGQVSYENAIALAIGANLGSTITAILGAIAANLGGRRLAGAHIIFNIVTAVVSIALIDYLIMLVDLLAKGLGIAPNDYLLKLALFHTLFNVMGVLLLAPFMSYIERFLIRFIRSAPTSIEQPLYLQASALQTPLTAVTAVHKEVLHLFDNAYGLLAHGLSLSRKTIDSDESLTEAVHNTRRIVQLDVDDAYEDKIKSLHSEIISFIGKAQVRETPHQSSEALYALRLASRHIVVAVKGMKHLHKNVSRYGISTNPAIRERYDHIRLRLAKLLRELRILTEQADHSSSDIMALSLDALKVSQEKMSQTLLDELDDMIRHQRISASVATSIMNDDTYVNDIANSLLQAVRVLLTHHHHSATQHMQLNDAEIQQLAESPKE